MSDSRLGGRSSGEEGSTLGADAEIGDGCGDAARDERMFDVMEPRRRLGTGAAKRAASQPTQSCTDMYSFACREPTSVVDLLRDASRPVYRLLLLSRRRSCCDAPVVDRRRESEYVGADLTPTCLYFL